METKYKDTGLRGKRPYQYKENKTPSLNREVYVNTYTLYTDDWFESGTRFAYSLHKTHESALKYKSFSWWSANYRRGEPVYVSKKTLEAICKERRGLFVSMED